MFVHLGKESSKAIEETRKTKGELTRNSKSKKKLSQAGPKRKVSARKQIRPRFEGQIRDLKQKQVPDVFVRLYLNLYSKKFKKVKLTIDQIGKKNAKKACEREKAMQKNSKTTTSYVDSVRRMMMFEEDSSELYESETPSESLQVGDDLDDDFLRISREIDIEESQEIRFKEDQFVAEGARVEMISMFDRRVGRETTQPCFDEKDLKIDPFHANLIPKLVEPVY